MKVRIECHNSFLNVDQLREAIIKFFQEKGVNAGEEIGVSPEEEEFDILYDTGEDGVVGTSNPVLVGIQYSNAEGRDQIITWGAEMFAQIRSLVEPNFSLFIILEPTA